MLESFPIAVLVGITLGFLSGLGVGGGSLLMVWMTAVLGWDPQNARAANLLFFLPSALIVCTFRYRQKKLNWKAVMPAIISGCFLAIAGSVITNCVNTNTMQKLFGILLIFAGTRELLYRERKAR